MGSEMCIRDRYDESENMDFSDLSEEDDEVYETSEDEYSSDDDLMSKKDDTLNYDEKEVMLLNQVKNNDHKFDELIKNDFCECLKRLHFFMGNSDKLVMLKNEPFFKLLQEIKSLYDSKPNNFSLVDGNHILEIKTEDEVKIVRFESKITVSYTHLTLPTKRIV